MYVWGGNGQILVGWHPVIRKDHRFIGIHFFSSPVPEGHLKTDTAFITPAAAEENILILSDFSMVTVIILVGRTLGHTPSTPCCVSP